MTQVVTLVEPLSSIAMRPFGGQKLTDAGYLAFCEANRKLHIERTADGEVVIMPPAGGESDYRSTEVVAELRNWAVKDGTGKSFGPSVQYFLPDGSGLSPDASWVSNESLNLLTKQERKKFLRLTPEFVVEVLSETDTLREAKAKMELWVANGVALAWLIDGDAKTVYVYRAGRAARTRRNLRAIAGEGSVAGFVLNLEPIWKGL